MDVKLASLQYYDYLFNAKAVSTKYSHFLELSYSITPFGVNTTTTNKETILTTPMRERVTQIAMKIVYDEHLMVAFIHPSCQDEIWVLEITTFSALLSETTTHSGGGGGFNFIVQLFCIFKSPVCANHQSSVHLYEWGDVVLQICEPHAFIKYLVFSLETKKWLFTNQLALASPPPELLALASPPPELLALASDALASPLALRATL